MWICPKAVFAVWINCSRLGMVVEGSGWSDLTIVDVVVWEGGCKVGVWTWKWYIRDGDPEWEGISQHPSLKTITLHRLTSINYLYFPEPLSPKQKIQKQWNTPSTPPAPKSSPRSRSRSRGKLVRFRPPKLPPFRAAPN